MQKNHFSHQSKLRESAPSTPSFFKKVSTIKRTLAAATLSVLASYTAAANTELYSTSFEGMTTGSLTQEIDGNVTWSSATDTSITTSHFTTGTKGLHIAGGTSNSVELTLSAPLQNARGISFQAERWTSADPFEFRIMAEISGAWQEAVNLDSLVFVGSFSSVVAVLPEGPITAIRLVCTAPDNTGILIDDFALLQDVPTNVTTLPQVATDPISGIVYSQALFTSGSTNTEKVTMVSTANSMTNYAGRTITLNGGATLSNYTHTYRIPAIITAANGDLIATCDARRDHGADLNRAEDIDIAVRRSSDNGNTWSDMEIMCDLGEAHPASDPSLVLDQVTGEIFCFYNYMDRNESRSEGQNEYRLWVQSSTDHGKTWGIPRDITDQITHPDWKFDFKFMTSGRGIQKRDGTLLHNVVNLSRGLFVFGSNDHGKTWFYNNVPISPADESKVIELDDGRLMVNSRVNGGYQSRHVHLSTDDGITWSGNRENQLADPGCNGAILRYTSVNDGYTKSRLLFSNASSVSGRTNLAVRVSYDEGVTWSAGKVVDPGASAYSDLTIAPDGTIGILYEPGYSEVRFTSITLAALTDNEDSLSQPYQMQWVVPKALPITPKAISLTNPSFELPATIKQTNWQNVPGWSSDSLPEDSGVEQNEVTTDGSWAGFLASTDPAVWQLTDHTIGENEEFTLELDAMNTGAEATSLRFILYYDNAGTRTPLATLDGALSEEMQRYTLQFDADDFPSAIGQKIGIEINNVATGWAGFDNVTLEYTKPTLDLEERSSSNLETQFAGNEIYDGASYINGWNENNPTAVTESLSGSELNRTHTTNSESWIGGSTMSKDGGTTTWETGNGDDWTLEARLKFNEVSDGFALWMGTGNGLILIKIYADRTEDDDADNFSVTHNNEDGAYHVYRITHDSFQEKYHVWRDGERLTPIIGADYDSNSTDNRLIIGDYSGDNFGNNANVDIDYISYDQQGAYLPVGADMDGDGIADSWEHRHFGHILGASEAADSDGDKKSNLLEFYANTDPNLESSSFSKSAIVKAAGDLWSITVPDSSTERVYTLQASTGLGANAVWSNVDGQLQVSGNGGNLILSAPAKAGVDPVQFFRVEVALP